MSDIKSKPVSTIREMLFELMCNEDIDSNEFDIQFDNEDGISQGFSVNINELSEAAVDCIDKLTDRVAELKAALSKIEEWDQHTIDLAVNQGSNGVRDLYRDVARKALKGES